MRIIRAIIQEPRHMTHTTNSSVRERLKVPSLESYLLTRRLLWFKAVLKGGDAIVGVRGALMGKLAGEARTWQDGGANSSMFQQLKLDLSVWLNKGETPQALYVNRECPAEAKNFQPTVAQMHQLAQSGPSDIQALLSYNTTAETNSAKRHEQEHNTQLRNDMVRRGEIEGRPCPHQGCGAILNSNKALSSHRWKTHGWIDPRRLEVTGRECPACQVTFHTRGYARTHYANRVCPQSRGEAGPADIDTHTARTTKKGEGETQTSHQHLNRRTN